MAAKSHMKEHAQGTEGPPQAGGPGRCLGRADSGAEPRGSPSGGLTTRGGEGTLFPAHLKLVTFSGTFQIHGVLLTRIPWLPKPRDHELF